jgi:predicted MPP superfamily phosphohydrolase
MRFEAGFVKVDRIDFTKDKKGVKIIQLSDIHVRYLKVRPQKIRQVIEKENPDLLFITGDYIDKPAHIPLFLNVLAYITKGYRTYLCLGNHDYTAFQGDLKGLAAFVRSIRETGVHVLRNETVCFDKNNKKYNLIGLEDLRSKNVDFEKALSSCSPGAFMNIALSHNPDIALEIPRGKVDYLFCGHFHGGQIWAPFNLEFKVLRYEKLCKMGVKRGLHKINGINLYINRGLGNVCVPLRFLSRPEITVIRLP